VLVQVNQYQGLYVDGQLNATGTALAPITFTGSTETPNWWGGLRIQNAGSATLDWCVVRYGGNNTYSFWGGNNNIYKTGTGSLTLRHSTLRDSSYEGLRVAAGYAAFVSASNTFRNNGRYGVAIGINASFDDNSSDFANNASVDALLDAGTISQSVVFRLKPDYSFYVNGNLTVASSGTLTILPGTVVKFPQYCGIFVDGTLTALGTSSEPIFFTDVRDDAVGGDANKDGADSLPAPNWWGAIRVQNAGSAALERCNLRYGGNNSYGNWGGNNGVLKSGSGDLSLRNTAVSQTYGAGLAISASAGAHLISECAFSNNVRGVEVAAGQTKDIALTNCAMVSNSSYGVLNSSVSCWVDALGCWWGDESGPYHATLNAAGKGDKVSARVRFDPWRVRASSCRILSPARSGTLVAGDMLRFTGAELGVAGPTYLWNFGSGRTFAVHSPGLVNFPQTGSVAVAYSATDDGSVDPFPDSRAYTVVPDTGTIPDLRVVSVSVPASLAVGQSAQISYTVRNAGQGAASGAWRDAVYLSDDANLDVLDTRLTAVSVNRTVAVGDSYQNSITVTLPAVEEKAYYLILVANEEWQLLERSRLNNEYAAPFTAQIPALTEGVAFAASYDAGRVEQYYRMTATSGRNLLLNSLNVPVGLEVYIRFGTLPTRGAYDYRLAAGDRLLIPAAAAGDWYILVYGDMGAAGQYQFEFDLEAVVLTQSLPTRHGTGTELDLTLTGAGFITPLGVALVSANSTVFAAYSVEVDSFTQATAKFLAGSVPAGTYAVRISRNGQTAQLTNALQVVADGAAKFDVQLILPARFGYHMLSTVYVEYANTGDAPMAAPLLLVSATQKGRAGAIMTLDQTRLSQGFWSAAMPEGFANSVQFMASGDTPGVIQPGESRRVPVYYAGWQQPWDFGYPAFDWNVGVLEETNQVPVNWDGMKAGMRPDYIRTDAWDVVWSNFKAQTGTTWGDYVAMLSRNALYLQRQGQRVENIESLLAFTFRQADGLCPIPVLASGMDSAVQSAGFPIVFERTYLQQISRRFERGPMGRGWTHNWQFALSVKSDGTVTVTGPSGTPRIFQPDSRYAGSYLAQPGDQGSLRSVGGGFRLTEANGTVQFFLADGKLDYIEDANGNRVTCNYSSGQLTGLSHTSGGSLQIAYNVGGCVASVTDHLGRQTGYTYDGDYLAAVRAYDGRTTTYRYQTASGASQHSLSAIGLPDGTIRVFTYDERGRLTGAYRDNQEEKITFTHADIGRVNVMDALGHTTKYFFDFWSRVVKVENALGEAVQKSFDDLGHLTSVTDPDGLSSTFAYDRSGNLAVISDAMRHSTRFTYTRAPNRVATVTDALNNRTDYRYDSRGNLTVMGYADGSLEQWGYDGQGNSTVWTNRRGRAVSFGYDTAGRITRKTYADASIVTYNYDGRGNLSKAVDSYGTNTFTYSTNDYLTRIDYPGGRWLSFGYDAVGRRTSTLDHLSYQMNCQYDAAGRLSRLSDGVGDIVQYAYDPLGRLERKTMGNGVYSIQTYDGAGRLTSMTNCKPDHSVLSSFAYTYDRRGRRTAMQAHYGTWTYQYDDVGQLTRAELVSTAGDIQDQVLAYTYDALGNRVRTTVNGQGEDYDVNSLNQYTQVGASTNTYDLDGNLIRQEGPNGATVYTYDDSKRLVGVTRGGTNWTYRYDPLGNRVAEDENGAVTHYVFDPVGLGNVVGEYNANGTQRARYTHGAGLVRRSAAADGIHYYTFDPMGNVSEMTGAAGAPQNAYAYRPFGETLRQDQLAPNPFKFMGQLGVMADNTGLYSMRARQYDPRLGRFTAMDPIGLGGGDANLYRYALNSPTHLVDPSGLAKCALSQEEADARWDKEFSTFTPEEYAKALKKIGYEAGKGRWSYGMNVVGMGISGVGGYLIETPAGVPLIAIGGVIALAPDVYFGVKESWRNYWNPPSADTLKVFCAINKHPVPPPTPPAKSGRNGASGSAGPQDPNRKISVAGFGTNNFVKADTLLPYRIEFENDKSALSPAQVVQISDPLAPQLDWNSFAITEVGFGNVLVQVQPGLNYYETVLDYAYADTNYDFQIEVHVKVWLENGQVYANFLSIDPDTGMPPPDVNTGFLMPEDGTGRGQGHVAFTFRPKPDLPSGTAIRNVATIQFDFGQKIDTDQVAPLDPGQGKDPAKQALVTFDAIAPSSSVAALTNNVPLEFPVSWAGQDDEHGSGIAGYDIYVRKNNGQWNLWLTNTPQISAVYTGAYAQAFSFYSVAIDNVGYAESKQAQAEASTVVELGGVRFAEETVSVSESDGVVALTIIGGKEGETNSAGYWILPGTATAGSDYTPPKTQPQRLTWTNTHGSQTIIIPITMDALIEDDETFYVLLGSPVGGEIGKERVCQVTITDANRSDTLADALDNVLLKWTTGGTPGWVPQNNVTFDGEDAAASGAMASNKASYVQTSVTGAGTLCFVWSVTNNGVLRLLDGTKVLAAVTNTTAWQNRSLSLTNTAAHPLKWEFTQGSSTNGRAYLDQVVWLPGGKTGVTVTAKANNPAGGTVSGSGVYYTGAAVPLNAKPRPGWLFTGWTPTNRFTKPLLTAQMLTVSNSAINVTANFAEIPVVTGLPRPPEGGAVTGSGLCLPGKSVTLKATAAKNWWFMGWSDGVQISSRTITASRDVTLCAEFKLISEIASPVIGNLGAPKAVVGVAFSLPVQVTSETLPTVTVTGLPAGLKYDAAAKLITGVPTAAGSNTAVTVTAKNVKATVTQPFSMTVDLLPLWASGAFNGWCELGSNDRGVATMAVTKPGKVTGKFSAGGSNYTFSAASYAAGSNPTDGFSLTANAAAGKAVMPLRLTVSYAATGSLSVANGSGLVMYRNVWNDPDRTATATNLNGYYTATLPGDDTFGSGYLACTLSKGVVNAAGKLADGTAVSLSSTLLVDESSRCFAVLYTAPTTYKGGSLFGVAEFLGFTNGGSAVFVHPVHDIPFVWENRNPLATSINGAGFIRELGLVGGRYGNLVDLSAYYANKTLTVGTGSTHAPETSGVGTTNRYEAVYWNPAGLPLTVVTNRSGLITGIMAPKVAQPVNMGNNSWSYPAAPTNTVGLTLTLNPATGLFQGSYHAWFDYAVAHTLKSIGFAGLLTPKRENMADSIEGRGFFLWADKATYTNQPGTYPFNWSYDFVIRSE
jgi:RHS repeat-associated protein